MIPFSLDERILIIFKRKELGLTIGELAKKIHMSKSNISRIESGKIAVCKENKRLFENYFSIVFSLPKGNVDEMFKEVTKELIFYNLFNNYSKKEFEEYCDSLNGTIEYPYVILLRLFVYIAKNIELEFCEKYLPIFEAMVDLFDDYYKKIIYLVKMNSLYCKKQYFNCIEVSEEIEQRFYADIIMDSYNYHLRTIAYASLRNLKDAKICIDTAYKLSEQTNNVYRLIAIDILRGTIYRMTGDYQGALKIDEKNMSFADSRGVHVYDYALLVNRAWTYYLLEEYEKAIKYYKKAELIDVDNDICFTTAYSSFCLAEVTESPSKKKFYRNQCREYLVKGRKAKSTDIAIPYLIEWLEFMLLKKYSIKAENRLVYCLKKYENKMHVGWRDNIYGILIKHYEYHNDMDKADLYREKLKLSSNT